eukprot:8343973-Pyramimonas_sp.AAC.1
MGEKTVMKRSGKLPKLPVIPRGVCSKTMLPHKFKYGKCEHCAVPIIQPFGPQRNPWEYGKNRVTHTSIHIDDPFGIACKAVARKFYISLSICTTRGGRTS